MELQAYTRWQELSEAEEKFLKQKAKIHWLSVGDRNNKFFHSAAKERQSRNSIKEIVGRDGLLKTSKEDIKEEAVSFFQDFLNEEPPDFEGASVSHLKELLNFQCPNSAKVELTRPVTDEEVRKVLFGMPANKAPGPDGYTVEFYKAAWNIVGRDFTVAVQAFFTNGFLPKGVNSTILSLVPKRNQARVMKDYRPIACCNVFYKVISKLIANRLKSLLPSFISPNQTAFVQNRLLVENVLLASELVKSYHKESITQRCAIKFDISKAFDTVQWEFIRNVLLALDFPEIFISWIQICISSASFSVQVNGELAGYFQSKRGLRQGCSLSPYLFVISMNVLSRLLDKGVRSAVFGFHPRCQALQLSHLCFADDLMVFSDGSQASIEGILSVFEDFAKFSGLKISVEKSTIYLAGLSEQAKAMITTQFPFATGTLPIRYLGLPLMSKKMSKADYLPLVEQIRGKMHNWKARYLSYAGRLELIKSVILSIVNFWSSAFRLPNSCWKEIEGLCAAFLWSGPDLNPKRAKVAWKDVCNTKAEGGLGVRSLKDANTVLILKLIWRVLSAEGSLWVDWIKMYLIRQGSFWSINSRRTKGSWIWKKILSYRDKAMEFHKVEVQNGEMSWFWFDDWCSLGRLWRLIGGRGVIDLGIAKDSRLVDISSGRRRRIHRVPLLNQVEEELELAIAGRSQNKDKHLWRASSGQYKASFSTKETWLQIREIQPEVYWSRGIWFSQALPKYSFIAWLAVLNRLTTGDRMCVWGRGVNTECVLCSEGVLESVKHLYFDCAYSMEIWSNLARGLMGQHFTTSWDSLLLRISERGGTLVHRFLLRFVFQTAIHLLWRERNRRRHGEGPIPAAVLVATIDSIVKTRARSLRREKHYENTFLEWFSYRSR